MRLNGSFTIEASVIIPLLTIMVVSIILLDFVLHDNIVNDVSKIMGGLRYQDVDKFYYDTTDNGISVAKIAQAPIVGDDQNFIREQNYYINRSVESYFNQKRISTQTSLSQTALNAVITAKSNSEIIRAGGRAVMVIGG